MLLQAASPLQLSIIVLDPEIASPAKQVSQPFLFSTPLKHIDGAFTDEVKIRELAAQVDILTIEIEHVDCQALEKVAEEFKSTGGRSGKGVKVYPSPSVIKIIQDKYSQKIHLQQKSIAVADFLQITSEKTSEDTAILNNSILAAGERFGYPLMLKSRHLAYDGKGNYLLRSAAGVSDALEALIPAASIKTGKPLQDRLYAEKFAPFVKEIAVMVVRGTDGQTRTYPAVETIHRESVCHIVYAPLRPVGGAKNGIGKEQRGMGATGGKEVGERARDMAEAAVDALGDGAVGVFGVEMFLMENGSSFVHARLT